MKKYILAIAVISLPQIAMAQDWQPINTAPHDGTIIEIENTWGVHPWHDLRQWSNENQWWQSVTKSNRGTTCENRASKVTCRWRPYGGNISTYRGPYN